MRVGIVIQQMSRNAGGVFEAAKLSCMALRNEKNYEFHILSTEDEFLAQDTEELAGTPISRSKAYGPSKFPISPGLLIRLLASKSDVVICHGLWSFHSFAAWIWHRQTKRPVVIVPHGMLDPWIMRRSKRLKALFWKTFTLDLLQRASVIQVLTERERRDVTALVPAAKCMLVRNFVSAPEPDLTRPDWWRSSDEGKTIFLFFGRLHEKKGVLELCSAWRKFVRRNRDVARTCELVFCGWVDGIANFEDEVEAAGAELANVRYVGPQFGQDKNRSMAAATYMILPSKSEGLPMSILEGWSYGLPAVMTAECNLAEGFLAGAAIEVATDEDSIADVLTKVAAFPSNTHSEMRQSAYNLIKSDFSEDVFVRQMKRLLSTI